MIKWNTKFSFYFSLVVSLLTLTACGGQAYQPLSISDSNLSDSNVLSPPNLTNSNTGTNSGQNNNDNGNNEIPSVLLPPITGIFSLMGSGSSPTLPSPKIDSNTSTNSGQVVVPAVNTDTRLRVSIFGDSIGTIPGTGYVFYSACLSFYVSIYNSSGNLLGTQKATLNTSSPEGSGYCSNAGTQLTLAQPTVDFSNRLTTGHGPIAVVITEPLSTTCGPTAVYGTSVCIPHTLLATYRVTGSYSIHINGTN